MTAGCYLPRASRKKCARSPETFAIRKKRSTLAVCEGSKSSKSGYLSKLNTTRRDGTQLDGTRRDKTAQHEFAVTQARPGQARRGAARRGRARQGEGSTGRSAGSSMDGLPARRLLSGK